MSQRNFTPINYKTSTCNKYSSLIGRLFKLPVPLSPQKGPWWETVCSLWSLRPLRASLWCRWVHRWSWWLCGSAGQILLLVSWWRWPSCDALCICYGILEKEREVERFKLMPICLKWCILSFKQINITRNDLSLLGVQTGSDLNHKKEGLSLR